MMKKTKGESSGSFNLSTTTVYPLHIGLGNVGISMWDGMWNWTHILHGQHNRVLNSGGGFCHTENDRAAQYSQDDRALQ